MRILYVTTLGGTCSFFRAHLYMLVNKKNKIDIACNFLSPLRKDILEICSKISDIQFSRNPFSKNNLKAYKELKKLIEENNYDIVHCHTPVASIITRVVCRRLRKNGLKVFYTAHGFHFYKGAPLKNWLLYYPIEWLCSFWTDVLITINNEDYQLAKKHMHSKNIKYIPGVGVDLEYINSIKIDKNLKKKELEILKNDFTFLSIGELNENKNHIVVLKAIKELIKEKKNNFKYIICGEGNKRKELELFIKNNKLENNVKLLGYRNDVLEIFKVIDYFIFPSYREGLSVSLMEAMANGIPCVVSNIRGNNDLIDKNGGILFNPNSVIECKNAMEKILVEDRKKIEEYNKNKIKKFSKNHVLNELEKIYFKE